MNRRDLTMRDMTLAMGILAVVVIAFAWLYGGMSVSPGRPDTTQATAPTADVEAGFARTDRPIAGTDLRDGLGFTALVPTGVPAEWHPSAWSTTLPGNAENRPPTARGGWLTPDGRFISLAQSTGDVPAVLVSEFGAGAGVTGDTVDAGGAQWQVTTGIRDEAAWVRRDGDLTLLITGTAPEADFRALAETLS